MKKSFFLLAAALAAIFSFSACSDDKGDGEPATGPKPIQFACTNVDEENLFAGGFCREYGGLSSADLAEAKAKCIEEDEDGDANTIVDKCPDGSVVACEEIGVYFYGFPGLLVQAMLNGECPDDPEVFFETESE
jgi:hypothetical protein